MDFYNNIAKISLEQFNKLPKTGKPTKNQWTILSTIIQENRDLNKLEVVALGTGTKCIGANKMSTKGDILNDSHAEIICRRSFLLYIYSQIKSCLNKESSIFILNENKFKLAENVYFHFFTTHTPCGDASIFPKNLNEDIGGSLIDENDIPIKKRKIDEDIYRTGAKCLKECKDQDQHLTGALYHKVSLIRTKPGRGDPTLSISCSDKITKWTYVGIQGALLSVLLEMPIYLKSITLSGGIPFCKDALNRAFNTRFLNDFNVKDKYCKCNLIINQSNEEFEFRKCDETNQPCPSSISWNKSILKPEISIEGFKQGVTKKKMGTKQARLQISKIELFRNFFDVTKMMNLEEFKLNCTYSEVKYKACDYQSAWSKVKDDIFKIWTKKDTKFINFYLD